jgi:hypothetical protein
VGPARDRMFSGFGSPPARGRQREIHCFTYSEAGTNGAYTTVVSFIISKAARPITP